MRVGARASWPPAPGQPGHGRQRPPAAAARSTAQSRLAVAARAGPDQDSSGRRGVDEGMHVWGQSRLRGDVLCLREPRSEWVTFSTVLPVAGAELMDQPIMCRAA
jgi:hypothetical protein